MKADIIAHSILYNTDNVKKSIGIMKECSTILADLCTSQQVKEELYGYYNKYKVVANALIADCSLSEQEKSNRYIVLEEIVNLFFLKWEENKKCFKFHDMHDKRTTIKYIYAKKGKINDLLHYNDFSIFKLFNRYLIVALFALFALVFAVVTIKILSSPTAIKTLADFGIFVAVYILCFIFIVISAFFFQRARKKERFIRPATSSKIETIIKVALSLLLPLLGYYVKHIWDSLTF